MAATVSTACLWRRTSTKGVDHSQGVETDTRTATGDSDLMERGTLTLIYDTTPLHTSTRHGTYTKRRWDHFACPDTSTRRG